MVLKFIGTNQDLLKRQYAYEFSDFRTGEPVATASYAINDWCKLYWGDTVYEVTTSPRKVEKPRLNVPYSVSSGAKKTIGFGIMNGNQSVGEYYGDALTCRKEGLFKKNFSITVFRLFEQVYVLYRVGFAGEPCHYYCLVDQNRRTVGIVQRYSVREDNSKATIFVENENDLLPILLVCTEEFVGIDVASDGYKDPTAAKYTSRYEEEQRLLDRDFLNRVKYAAGYVE